MKIGIDTFGCDHSQNGNGSYLLNFIRKLPETSDFKFELFGLEEDRYTYKTDFEVPYTSISIYDNVKAELYWHRFCFSKFVKKQAYDYVLFPAADKILPTKFKGYKGIAVVNSILSKHNKEKGSNSKHHILKGLQNIDIIIAATEYIRDDLVKLGIKPEKISVIYNGIDHKMFYPVLQDDSDFVEVNPFAIKKPYFIYGSRLSGPEKKHIELIKAFELFKKITGTPCRLVISGSDDEYAKEIHKAAYESEYSSDIFLTGYFPHESFAKLYAGACACVFPAINEGVGLPILEAMACGIPVLCSDSGALKEIGGNVPMYFNPDNIPEIADAMQKALKDTEIIQKKISEGLEKSQSFSWEKTVEETLKLIK